MRTQTAGRSTNTLVALALCMALHMTGFVMILPLFARRFDSFGTGVQALSMSALAYALTSTFAAPFMGTLADRVGRRPIILFSLTAYILAFSGYLFAVTAWLLILFRGLAGVFTAGLAPVMMSTVGDLAPENRRGQWIGIVNGGAAVGWITGPLLGGLLYDRFGYVVPFATSIVTAVAALLIAQFLIHETRLPAVHPGHRHTTWTHGWQALSARAAFLLLLLITFGVMFAWAFIEPQFMFYAYDELDWTSAQLGMVMRTYGLAFMLGEFILGRLSDHLGRKPVIVLGLALFSAQFAGLVIFHDVTWIVVSFLLAGLGNALYDPALSALILDISPPEHTAGMMGLKSTAGLLGSLLGPGLLVLFTPFVTPQMVFLIATALVVMLACASGLALRLPPVFAVANHAVGDHCRGRHGQPRSSHTAATPYTNSLKESLKEVGRISQWAPPRATPDRSISHDNHVNPWRFFIRESHRAGLSAAADAWRPRSGSHDLASLSPSSRPVHPDLL
jgi:MFS family permease